MKLVYKNNPQREVAVNDIIDIDGVLHRVDYFRKPSSPNSEGKVTLETFSENGTSHESEFYVSVIGAHWIEREDRGWITAVSAIESGHLIDVDKLCAAWATKPPLFNGIILSGFIILLSHDIVFAHDSQLRIVHELDFLGQIARTRHHLETKDAK